MLLKTRLSKDISLFSLLLKDSILVFSDFRSQIAIQKKMALPSFFVISTCRF